MQRCGILRPSDVYRLAQPSGDLVSDQAESGSGKPADICLLSDCSSFHSLRMKNLSFVPLLFRNPFAFQMAFLSKLFILAAGALRKRLVDRYWSPISERIRLAATFSSKRKDLDGIPWGNCSW